jgi:hypothetical protein
MQPTSSLKSVVHDPHSPREAVHRVNHSLQNLARNYVSLFKLYAHEGSGIVAMQAAKGVGAGIALLIGWNMFVLATIFAVTPAVPLWASIGFWALFHLGVGGYLLMNIRKELKTTSDDLPRPQPVEPLRTQAERDPGLFAGGFVP